MPHLKGKLSNFPLSITPKGLINHTWSLYQNMQEYGFYEFSCNWVSPPTITQESHSEITSNIQGVSGRT